MLDWVIVVWPAFIVIGLIVFLVRDTLNQKHERQKQEMKLANPTLSRDEVLAVLLAAREVPEEDVPAFADTLVLPKAVVKMVKKRVNPVCQFCSTGKAAFRVLDSAGHAKYVCKLHFKIGGYNYWEEL